MNCVLAGKVNVGVDLDQLGDDWGLHSLETIQEDWHLEGEESQNPIRVDPFWRKVDDLKDTTCEKKFSPVVNVIETARVLRHEKSKGDFREW